MTPPYRVYSPPYDSWDAHHRIVTEDLGQTIVGDQWQLPTVQDLQMGSMLPQFAKLVHLPGSHGCLWFWKIYIYISIYLKSRVYKRKINY
jgi:hypothetical protein